MAATQHTFNAEASTLCEKCSVLRINDRELFGLEAQNDDGEDTSSVSSEGEYFQGKLNYIHYDLLPDLPYLRATAEEGCAFCAMLRNTVLEQDFVKPARVTFSLSYSWKFFSAPERGVCNLLAHMQVGDDGPGNYYVCTPGIFEVDCKEGDSRPDLLDVLSDCTR